MGRERIGGEARAGEDKKQWKCAKPQSVQTPQKAQLPVRATTSWEVNKKGPTRTLQRKRVPTKRYGTDVITKAENMSNETDTE